MQLTQQQSTHQTQIQQQLQTAIQEIKALQEILTEVIDSYVWRSDPYLDDNVINLEYAELDTVGMLKKLDRIQKSIQ